MTFLAERGGARVPEVVTAGLADNGDALIVVRPNGSRVDLSQPELTIEQVRGLWDQLAHLHASGIVHHRIDLDRVVSSEPHAGFIDLSSASVKGDPIDAIIDRAQLLALTIATTGTDGAIDNALAAIGHDGLAAVMPYFQEAALLTACARQLRHNRHDVDKIRKQILDTLEVPEIELVKVRRVTWKSLLNLTLLAVAAYTIIGMLSGLDLHVFFHDLKNANWWWLLAALLIAQLPRFANALSTLGSSPRDLPYGPTVVLQFATCYVNLAVPSSAGRIAITTRFFQRFGVPPATALAASVIDSLSEFTIQIALFLMVFFISDVDLGVNLNTDQLSGLATTALIVVIAVIVAGVIAFAVPAVRHRVTAWIDQARDALKVLRSGRKLLQLYGGNLLSQVLFAVTLGAGVRAFGFEVPLSSLILINTVVGLFAGLLPVPGGVGVSEAGLALGLTRAGIPSETSFAIALTTRFCTFYLPPVWGLASYKWLASHRYL